MTFCRGLLALPNCVILHLLRYLDATSLYLLGRTCVRLDDIIRNSKILWRRIDARRAPNDRAKISYCLDRCTADTHTFLIRADNQQETLVTESYYLTINKWERIAVLALENQTIDGENYKVSVFPPQLDELSLKKTSILSSLEFFKGSGDHFQGLRVLILDECNWLTSSAFMSISKYQHLEILSVFKCKNLENSIAYLGLSGHGFKKLRIFDARLSPLGNTLIRSIYRSPSLLAIYLQNEDISYKLDYFKRKLDVMKGAPTRDFYVKDDEFDLKDTLTNEENGLNYEDPEALDDRGLIDYLSTVSIRSQEGLPRSALYLDPYNECSCRYEKQPKQKDKTKKEPAPPADSSSSDDDDDQGGDDTHPIRQISDKIARLAHLIRRGQINNTYSRGIFNHNHPRSPLTPTVVITVHNSNGDTYRSLHDYENNVCVMNLEGLEQEDGRRQRRRQSGEGVSKSRIFNMISDVYNEQEANSDSDDDFTVTVEKQERTKKPTVYYHRDGNGAGTSNNNRNQPIIDVHINPPEARLQNSEVGVKCSPSTNEIRLRDASNEIRKRIHESDEGPERKKTKMDEATPGPSGLNHAPSDDESESDLDSPPPSERRPTPHPEIVANNPEKAECFIRRIYFRDSPIVQIENLEEVRKETFVPLRRLSLRGYKKITNQALQYIKDLDLELLDLTYTNVSREAIENYLVDHPNCRVVQERFCTCPTNLHF